MQFLNPNNWRFFIMGMISVFDIFGISNVAVREEFPVKEGNSPAEKIAGYWQTVGTLLSKEIELLEANGAAEFQKEQRKI